MDTKTMQITVLGKHFSSDEERREFFRNELRDKLPTLRNLPGFPEGSDNDIIQLSDPPYFTACPNPWLDDFLRSWETERTAETKDNEITEPFAVDVSVGKNHAIYKAHGYHTKVPHLAILKYLLYYTKPGDVIYDGFSGTGMTGVAAKFCSSKIPNQLKYKLELEFEQLGVHVPIWGKRNCILTELAPIGSYIGYNYNRKHEIENINTVSDKIVTQAKSEFEHLYRTKHINGNDFGIINYVVWSDVYSCPTCNSEMIFWDVAVDTENGKVKDSFLCRNCHSSLTKKDLNRLWETVYDKRLAKTLKRVKSMPVMINYSLGKKRFEKTPDQEDFKNIQTISDLDTNDWYPTDELPEGDKTKEPIRTHGVQFVHQFYTRRNLLVLARLWNLSQNAPVVRWALTGIMNRASIQHQIAISRVGGEKAGEGGKTAGHRRGTIAIPTNKIEYNVFKLLEDRLKSITKALNSSVDGEVVIQTCSTTHSNIEDNSIDYIFTDPPFGANIMYSELNYLWDSWLKVKTNNKEEAIQNRTQKKSAVDYSNLMKSSFSEYFRILKPGKWMTVEFSNTSAEIWNAIQNSLQNSGFVIANVSSLNKKQQTHNSRVTKTAVKQDLVISCYKPSEEFETNFNQHISSEIGIWDFIEEHLRHLPIHLVKDNATSEIIERSPKILYDRLIAFYVQKNLPVPIDAAVFQKGLVERYIERDGMYFTLEQVQEYDVKKENNPEFIQLSILISSEQDGVLWLKNLLMDNPSTYQDIQPQWMQALAGIRKGDVIPELSTILEENFLKNNEGKWYAPDPENEADLEKIRSKRLLKQFSEYKEIAYKPKGKIKEVRVEALRAGFKDCYQEKDFKTIVQVGDRIPNNLLMEDEVLLQFYDIAVSRV